MTETERKVLVERLGQAKNNQLLCIQAIAMINHQARAIEQHEAFRQEVSKIIEDWWYQETPPLPFRRFIIPKPDPLVGAVTDVWPASCDEHVNELRAAIEKRGGKIVWGEG